MDITCYNCTTHLDDDDVIKHNGHDYCADCVSVCESCHETIDNDEIIVVNDDTYCTSCAIICEHCDCGEISDNSHTVGRETWCEGCWESDTFYCENCNENYSDRYNYYSVQGTTYCESCYEDNAYYCEDCDEYFNNEDSCNCDNNLTSRCCRGSRQGVGVHEYNCKPDPIFKGSNKHGVYLGFELETEFTHGIDEASSYASTALDGVAYLKHDGSLNHGFEIVTHPHTHLEYRENSTLLWDTIDTLRKTYRARSWDTDTCGLHVHISRKGFTSGAHLHRFIAFVYHNAPTMIKFAGRKSRFARFNDVYTFDEYDRPIFSLKHKVGDPNRNASERYSAVNTQNSNTIELRFFRGTMNTSGVLSALDLTQAMVEYTRELRLDDVKLGALSWEWFVDYVQSNNGLYPDLYSRLDKIQEVDIKKPLVANA